jgi:hypothetical protein
VRQRSYSDIVSGKRAKRLKRAGLALTVIALALLVPSMWFSASLVGRHACVGLQAGYLTCSWEEEPLRPKRWLTRLSEPPRMVWLPKLLLVEDGVTELTLPLWLAAAAGAALVAVGCFCPRRAHACPSCGYDRSGSPSRACPECGSVPP